MNAITTAQLESLHAALKSAPLVGTFLDFSINLGGKPSAHYTHGSIMFENFDDLVRWLNLTDQQRWEEASKDRMKR